MPETNRPTRTVEKEADAGPHRKRDPRADDVGLDSTETEERSEGVGFAEDRRSPATEHKTGRTDDGSAT